MRVGRGAERLGRREQVVAGTVEAQQRAIKCSCGTVAKGAVRANPPWSALCVFSRLQCGAWARVPAGVQRAVRAG